MAKDGEMETAMEKKTKQAGQTRIERDGVHDAQWYEGENKK